MDDHKNILHLASEFRRNKTGYYCSNIFSVPPTVKQYERANGAAAFSIDDKGVERVYFTADNPEDLAAVLERFGEGAGIEIIGKTLDDETRNALEKAGFKSFCVYLRATIPNLKEDIYKNLPERFQGVKCWDYIEYATLDDLDAIYDMLYETFKPLTSHLQDREELKQQILDKRFVVSRTDGEVSGLMSYEYQGRKLYMEHAVNRGASINMHAMYFALLEKAIDDGINTAYTWMRDDNDRVLAFTRRYGYVIEDIKNYVFQK